MRRLHPHLLRRQQEQLPGLIQAQVHTKEPLPLLLHLQEIPHPQQVLLRHLELPEKTDTLGPAEDAPIPPHRTQTRTRRHRRDEVTVARSESPIAERVRTLTTRTTSTTRPAGLEMMEDETATATSPKGTSRTDGGTIDTRIETEGTGRATTETAGTGLATAGGTTDTTICSLSRVATRVTMTGTGEIATTMTAMAIVTETTEDLGL